MFAAGPASDHAQYGVLTPASAAYGQVAASGGSGTVSSPRGQSGSWGRPSSRPSSNPSPSRGAGHLSGSQMGRTTPSRTAGGSSSRSSSSTASQHKFAYGYEQQQQQQTVQQLGEFFTATSLKVPQRYGERVADSRQGSCRGQVSCTHARKPQVLQETDELAQNAGFDHRAHVSSSVLSKHGCLQGPARCCRILELACSAGLIAGSARLSTASAHGMHPCSHSNSLVTISQVTPSTCMQSNRPTSRAAAGHCRQHQAT
jgi:hypothetical protein